MGLRAAYIPPKNEWDRQQADEDCEVEILHFPDPLDADSRFRVEGSGVGLWRLGCSAWGLGRIKGEALMYGLGLRLKVEG